MELRDAVNAIVPGLVDVEGNFDPSDPGIAQITRLSLAMYDDPIEDLQGIEYFDSLDSLAISFYGLNTAADTCRIPFVPTSLKQLFVYTSSGQFEVGQLPDSMDQVMVHTAWGPLGDPHVHIAGIGAGLRRLDLNCPTNITWGEPADVGELNLLMSICGIPGFTMSPISCANFHLLGNGLWSILGALDVSSVECERMDISNLILAGSFVWPDHVPSLNIYESSLLPDWPAEVDSIRLYLAPNNSCIPLLPNGLRYINMDFYPACIPNWPDDMENFILNGVQMQQGDLTYCSVLNSSCPGIYPSLSGSVSFDLNGNGTVDPGEPPMPQTMIHIQPNANTTGCDASGNFEVGVFPGTYTLSAATDYPYAVNVSPAAHSAAVLQLGDIDNDNHFAVAVQPDIQDLRVTLYADPARPGFDNQVHLYCENYGTIPVNAEVTLTFDADQTWLNSSVLPVSTTGNTASWNFTAMPVGTVQHIIVGLNTAASIPLGTDITHTLIADPVATDETPLNNSTFFNDSVVGSYDPNDKLLSPAVLTPDEVTLGETPIAYTIRFQNTGTYLAERVVILDTLSTDLQWESMRFIASSHDHTWYIVNGVLHVIHNDIMLPDSNTNEAASHGFFKFSMLPKTDLGNGAVIENIAHIVFDFNEPIVTEPAVFMVDIGAGIAATTNGNALRVHPNPAQDRIQVTNDMVLPYRIMNALGQPMQQGLLVPGAWLDVHALPAGAYILETTEAGARTSLRFVKQ
ncbi:MAG TPA: T9SS type A sorting domain-containing protein [Flavobacteriales bacterium]|nr:T9SS type A sorting domain-containing protein [Flavobacteriales bacterium]